MKLFSKRILALIKKSTNDNITLYAAQSAFFLILSSIPFLMMLLSVVQLVFDFDQDFFQRLFPKIFSLNISAFLLNVTDELISKPPISFLSISAVTTLWSASLGFSATEKGIKAIYKIPARRYIIVSRLLSLLYTLLFVAVLVAVLVAIVFGGTIISFVDSHIPWISLDVGILEYILGFFGLLVFFSVLYASFSSRKIAFKFHLPGALFSAFGWGLFSWAFSIYVNNFSNHSKIYGSLTTLVLLMLWVYFCMIILLFGAEINISIIKRKEKQNDRIHRRR